MAPTAACECDTEEQTADHIITSGPIFHHPNRGIGLESVNDETVALPNIKPVELPNTNLQAIQLNPRYSFVQ